MWLFSNTKKYILSFNFLLSKTLNSVLVVIYLLSPLIDLIYFGFVCVRLGWVGLDWVKLD